MKQLSKYINETLKQSQSDHINEWKYSSNTNVKLDNDDIDKIKDMVSEVSFEPFTDIFRIKTKKGIDYLREYIKDNTIKEYDSLREFIKNNSEDKYLAAINDEAKIIYVFNKLKNNPDAFGHPSYNSFRMYYDDINNVCYFYHNSRESESYMFPLIYTSNFNKKGIQYFCEIPKYIFEHIEKLCKEIIKIHNS